MWAEAADMWYEYLVQKVGDGITISLLNMVNLKCKNDWLTSHYSCKPLWYKGETEWKVLEITLFDDRVVRAEWWVTAIYTLRLIWVQVSVKNSVDWRFRPKLCESLPKESSEGNRNGNSSHKIWQYMKRLHHDYLHTLSTLCTIHLSRKLDCIDVFDACIFNLGYTVNHHLCVHICS